MRTSLIVYIVFVCGSIGCRSKDSTTVNLSTPENAIKSYYAAFEAADFELQKKTLESSIQTPARERYDAVNPILQDFQILNIREAKDRTGDTFRLPEDAVEVLVKEVYVDSIESINSFVLREFDSRWLIVDYVTENEAEFPPDVKAIEEQAKGMLEEQGDK